MNKSSTPQAEAPEHKEQLGDMTIVISNPVLTVADTFIFQGDYEQWLGGRKDSNANRAEFAKGHFGNMGRGNISLIPLEDFYPGITHLAICSAETISLTISS